MGMKLIIITIYYTILAIMIIQIMLAMLIIII